MTDGKVGYTGQIEELIKQNCYKGNKVFSFGIGDNCDKNFVRKSALAGKGLDYYVSDSNLSELK